MSKHHEQTGAADSQKTGSAGTGANGAGPRAPGNGKDPHTAGNGHGDPFADVNDDFDGNDGDWQSELPTEHEVREKPSSIYATAKLRALVKLHDNNLEDCVDLIRRLVAAAADPDVTRAKVYTALKERARKDQQEAKAAATDDNDGDEFLSVADQLVRQVVGMVAAQQVIIGHTEDGTGYIRCPVGNDVLATYRIDGTQFRGWVRRRYYADTKKSLRADALNQVVGTIAAIAEVSGEEIDRLFVRVAVCDGSHYLDLGTPDWNAIEISPGIGENGCGWQLVARPPVWFIRSATMLALPMPVPGGSIRELRPFLNVVKDGSAADGCDDSGFILSVGHCIGALNPDGPFDIAFGQGSENAAKTTWMRVLRNLIDPSRADRRGPPATVIDLLRHGQYSWMPSFDNVTSLTGEICNAFCRLSTGGGDVVRRLYTDDGEVVYESTRPVIMTSIMDVITRPDMLSRTMFVMLASLTEDETKTEELFWEEFEETRPRILGALLSAVAHGLAQPRVNLKLPRLADFAAWVTRCEGGLGWEPGTFLAALRDNSANSVQDALDNDPLVGAIRRLLNSTPAEPDGTHRLDGQRVSELKDKIHTAMGDYDYRTARLPRTANHFSGRLRQATPLLARAGITMKRTRSAEGSNITLWLRPDKPDEAKSENSPEIAQSSEDLSARPSPDHHRGKPQNTAISDDHVDHDDQFPSFIQKKKRRPVKSASAGSPVAAGAGAGQQPPGEATEELW